MGALPKRKISKQRKGNRRSHDALKKPALVVDKETGELRRPHRVSKKTGRYAGKEIEAVK